MTIRQEILQTIQNFLSSEAKPKKAYRAFTANLKRLSETPRLQDLTLSELSTCQQIQTFLKNWSENYSQHPKIFSKEAELSQIQAKFAKWLEIAQKKTDPHQSKPHSVSTFNNWETKLEKAEKGLQWLDWWEKHQTVLKFTGIIISLLFAWLIIEKIKEKFT